MMLTHLRGCVLQQGRIYEQNIDLVIINVMSSVLTTRKLSINIETMEIFESRFVNVTETYP